MPADDILSISGCRSVYVDFALRQIDLGFLNDSRTEIRLLAPRLPKIMSLVQSLTLFMGNQRGHVRSKVGMSVADVVSAYVFPGLMQSSCCAADGS